MVTRREKYLLWKVLKYHISRYLLANSHQRLDGFEKAQRHFKISELLCEFILSQEVNDTELIDIVHDYLSDILTSKMDEVIGFPIRTKLYNDTCDDLTLKFFNVIIDNISNIEKLILK